MHRSEPWEVDERLDADVLNTTWFRILFVHAMTERFLCVRFNDEKPGRAGDAIFETTPGQFDGNDPSVVVYCREWGVIDDDIAATITLAHELGHHESWLRGDAEDEVYAAALDGTDSVTLRQAIFDEEERAWRYGRELLERLAPAFPAFVQFDSASRTAIEGYRVGLGLTSHESLR